MPPVEPTSASQSEWKRSLGILLVNLGTPDEPTPAAVRRYLKQFLSDPRVVEWPRWLWWLVLNGIILRFRPARSAAAYRKIWTGHGSPLLAHTLALAAEVQRTVTARITGEVLVIPGMTYGNPSIDAGLETFLQQGIRRIVVLPLYPQYAASTTGSAFDAVAKALCRQRWVPELRFINHYHDAEGYISALVNSIREFWEARGRGERLLFSFHGLPRRMIDKGDPYLEQCQETANRVTASLGLDDREWQLSFQSRVGGQEWLRPYTDLTLQQWGEKRMGRIDVVCPGFAVDCLETLEEIAIQNAERFTAAGGGELRYVPCLNTRADHVAFLAELAEQHAGDWTRVTRSDLGNRRGAGAAL